MISDSDGSSDNDVEDPVAYRTTTFNDRYAIFMAVRSIMANGREKMKFTKSWPCNSDSAVLQFRDNGPS
jgi:hypothetical protein